MHALLNADKELAEQKAVHARDLNTCHKVDTHVHHSGCMTQKHLLAFIRRKLTTSPEDIVAYQTPASATGVAAGGTPVTLAEAFACMDLTAEALSIDTLDMHAHDTYQRFDKFNNKFNPAGI